MDELLNDFLAETSEHLESASTQLVMFESDPTNSAIVSSIFRLVHTIKGTCGFLGLTRLEALTHEAGFVWISASVPCATTSPPWTPGPGPRSTM